MKSRRSDLAASGQADLLVDLEPPNQGQVELDDNALRALGLRSGAVFEVVPLKNGKFILSEEAAVTSRKRDIKNDRKRSEKEMKAVKSNGTPDFADLGSEDEPVSNDESQSNMIDIKLSHEFNTPRQVRSVALLDRPYFMRADMMPLAPHVNNLHDAKTLATQILKGAKRNHIAKTPEQEEQLFEEWRKNPMFSKKRLAAVAESIGLSESQVYKWVWDRNRGKGAVMQMARQLLSNQGKQRRN